MNEIYKHIKESTKKSFIDKFKKTIRTRIQVKSLNIIEVFNVFCQKNIFINIKYANLLCKL